MMAAKPKMQNIPPLATPHDRDSSPELGSPSKTTEFNKQTGRPVRKSAGKINKAAGYVDYNDEEFGPLTTESEEDEEDKDEMESHGRIGKRKKRLLKRKRSPSPPSPRLEPIIYDQELDELTDDEEGGAFHRRTPRKPPITLQFNVPLGFHGPLFVKLDSILLQTNEQGTVHGMQPGRSDKARTASPQPKQASVVCLPGFTDLPPEVSVHFQDVCETYTNLY
jgi:hypothetical protein